MGFPYKNNNSENFFDFSLKENNQFFNKRKCILIYSYHLTMFHSKMFAVNILENIKNFIYMQVL